MQKGLPCDGSPFFLSDIKGRVDGIEILFVEIILNISEAFTEPLVVNDFSFSEEADRVDYIRVVGQS